MSNNNVSLDIDFVRAQFPAFKDPLSSLSGLSLKMLVEAMSQLMLLTA